MTDTFFSSISLLLKFKFTFLASTVLFLNACSADHRQMSNNASGPSHQPLAQVQANGQERGNGLDYQPIENQAGAWFTGRDRVVHYCVEVSNDFGLSRETARREIETAFAIWSSYIQFKGVKIDVFVRSAYQAICDDSADLKFYLGVQNQEVKNHLPESPVRLGIAIRTSYDLDKGWGQGFIWITKKGAVKIPESDIPASDNSGFYNTFPDWGAPRTLLGIVLHEIGHVYGAEHILHSIMDVTLADKIQWYFLNQDKLVSIDWEGQLIPHPTADIEGTLGLPQEPSAMQWPECRDTVTDNFRLLMGRDPVGQVTAKLNNVLKKDFSIILRDAKESVLLKVELFPAGFGALQTTGHYYQVFEVNKKDVLSREVQTSWSYLVKIHARDGKILTGLIQRNINTILFRGPTAYEVTGDVMQVMLETGPQILFQSALIPWGHAAWPPQSDVDRNNCLQYSTEG